MIEPGPGTVKLETDRLILRRFTMDDAYDMYANWAGDDEVTRFLVWPTHAGLDVSREVIDGWLKDYECPGQYIWCLEFKGDHQAIGSLGVVGRNPETGAAWEIGYCLSRAFWGQGLMSEALTAVVRFLFDQAGAGILEARIDKRNLKSESVLTKCGFKFNRVDVGGGLNNLGRYDAQIYRIEKPSNAAS
ncbi:N-acetyltransferase [Deltaproteobacteria bacterium Smac51]|nr:N-acetyltransferase [Deltaproteobacteria bacterium Smac51]